MKKKVLILNTSHNDLGMIKALKLMDLYVIAIGNKIGLIGQQYVDEYYCMDYSKKEEVLNFARELDIQGICACCNDFGVITAAYVAEKLGFKGYDSYNDVLTIHHKNLFKRFSLKNEILTSKAHEFNDLNLALDYVKTGIEYPAIVKPVDLSAGNGIRRVDCKDDAFDAIEKAFLCSRTKEIVIEPYIEGTQHGFCTFLREGKVIACCSNNEYSIINPYRVEIDTFPADNIEMYKEILIGQVEKIAKILDLKDGIFHMQYIVKNGRIYILEAMRRVLGNMYSIPAAKVSDFDWDYWQARVSIGLNCDNIPQRMESKGYFAYRAIMSKDNGIISDVIIDESLEPYIFDKLILCSKGQEVTNYQSETLGLIFFEFSNKDEMKRIMIDEYDKIYVELDDENEKSNYSECSLEQ